MFDPAVFVILLVVIIFTTYWSLLVWVFQRVACGVIVDFTLLYMTGSWLTDDDLPVGEIFSV